MLPRTVTISVGLILLISLEMLVVSCDEVKHRDVLTFFFDGVEPAGPEGFEEGPFDPNEGLAQAAQPPAWYVHEPLRDCTLCHVERGKKRTSLRAFLVAGVPQLCDNCHDDYTASAPFVHGPVAVGQCLFCHHHHKSRFKYLLKQAEPDLCYICHDTEAVAVMPGHMVKELSRCTDCHNAHGSSERALLKDASLRPAAELDRAKLLEKAIEGYVQDARTQDWKKAPPRKETTQTAAFKSDSLFQVLWTVNKLIEQGELQKARAYLEELKDDNAFTDQQRAKIAEVLSLMDRAAAGRDVAKPKEKKPATITGKDDPEFRRKMQENADLFYLSMNFYREGELVKAWEGFVTVLNSGLIPEAMGKTIRGYLLDIDKRLAAQATPPETEK
ncbi:MAG: cytochrome c3 family protein [Planctomycetota bacterium]